MEFLDLLKLILRYYGGDEVEFNRIYIVSSLYDLELSDAYDLADLIEHEPVEGGLLGLSQSEMRIYRQEILDLAGKILKELD